MTQNPSSFVPSLVPSGSGLLDCPAESRGSLKRSASPSFDSNQDETSRKRLKESEAQSSSHTELSSSHRCAFAEELAQELQCPCCSALAHRPVVVVPCQHMFCGSCCMLWIKNGGTSCPSCRAISSTAIPSRPLEIVIESLIRSFPHHARASNELKQADQVYKQGIIRIPSPRETSPEPNLNQNFDYARPCPTCHPSNPYGWTCPNPVPDPATVGLEGAWPLEDGPPPGHGHCGNCESLLNLSAPMSSRCDFCATPFCGIGVRGRCQALDVSSQTPQDLNTLEDFLTCVDIYDQSFSSNAFEVEILLDYLSTHHIRPRTIYQQIVLHLQDQPNGFEPLIDDDVFPDAPMGNDDGPIHRRRICRECARTMLLWGLRDWWIRERKNGQLDAIITQRPDCPQGLSCGRQKEREHASTYNHIIPPVSATTPSPEPSDVTGSSKINRNDFRDSPFPSFLNDSDI